MWAEEDRLNLLAIVLENVGTAAAVRMGDPEVWRQAIARLDDERGARREGD